jgi:hypothetical protein
LIEERTGAKVRQFGQMFKINPEVSDVAGNYAIHYKGVDLLVLGAVQHAAGGCARPESAVKFEPLVSAAAYALASILDRCRHRVFPARRARRGRPCVSRRHAWLPASQGGLIAGRSFTPALPR